MQVFWEKLPNKQQNKIKTPKNTNKNKTHDFEGGGQIRWTFKHLLSMCCRLVIFDPTKLFVQTDNCLKPFCRGRLLDRSLHRSFVRSVHRSDGRAIEEPIVERIHRAMNRSTERSNDRVTDGPSDRASDRAAGRPGGRANYRATERCHIDLS